MRKPIEPLFPLIAFLLACAPQAWAAKHLPASLYDNPVQQIDPWKYVDGHQSMVTHEGEKIGNIQSFERADGLMVVPSLISELRPVGRFEIKRRDAGTGAFSSDFCTAWLVDQSVAVTNHHCIAEDDPADQYFEGRVRFGAFGEGEKGRVYTVTKIIEDDDTYDFALLQLDGAPGADFGIVSLDIREALDREPLMVIGHPLAHPLMVMRANCYSWLPAILSPDLHHHCDTLGGSSGSVIFAQKDGRLVGLHYSAPSYTQDFNLAKDILQVVGHSPTLTRILDRETHPVTPGAAPTSPAPAQPAQAQPAPSQPFQTRPAQSQLAPNLYAFVQTDQLGLLGVQTFLAGEASRPRIVSDSPRFETPQVLAASQDAEPPAPAAIDPQNLLREGLAAEARKDYTAAATAFVSADALGDKAAAGYLGRVYATTKQYDLSRTWYRKAADQGDARGYAGLGYLLEYGPGPADAAQALTWTLRAADEKFAPAQYLVGRVYEPDSDRPVPAGVQKDMQKAMDYFQKAGDQGYALANYELGRIYAGGLGGVGQDVTKARTYLDRAARLGVADAKAWLDRYSASQRPR